jgi:pimeloyl-ACP methyl ester carboxylesterase
VFWQAHGRGPALILINGFAASARMWPRAWLRRLERRFRVVTLDNRGSGFSRFVATPFSIADMADDAARVMADAELSEAVVFGISMGGMVAQELALRHPQLVTSLVLAATRPPNPAFQPPSLQTRWRMVQPPRPGTSLGAHFDRLWSYSTAPGFPEAHPAVMAEVTRQSLERPMPRALMLHQSRAMAAWGHSERLRAISAPTVVVHGALDRLCPPANGRRVSELIPDARYVELAGVGHLIPQERPEALVRLIEGAVQRPAPERETT